MIRILATVFAALLGLAFGSFLNVCLSRWPVGQSVVSPPSHCRKCGRMLPWWENIPLASWLWLRGRCRRCGTLIGWRSPLVEAAVGALWAYEAWSLAGQLMAADQPAEIRASLIVLLLSRMILYWLLVALTFLDAEYLWLPDVLTVPGTALGLAAMLTRAKLNSDSVLGHMGALGLQDRFLWQFGLRWVLGIAAAALLMLLIRWLYWLKRRREGLGLGDAKLMAMLAAWLGFSGALLAFGIGVVLGAAVGLGMMAVKAPPGDAGRWASRKLPLGTFLCIGGLVTALWGEPIIDAYLHWAGF